MDPADSESIRQAFTSQAAMVKQHETTLLRVMDHVPAPDFNKFTEEMKRTFDHLVHGHQAVGQLQQGTDSVSQYAIPHFGSRECGGGFTIASYFHQGFSEQAKDELALSEQSSSLNHLIELAIRLNNRIRERSRERLETRRRHFPANNPLITPDASQSLHSTIDNASMPRLLSNCSGGTHAATTDMPHPSGGCRKSSASTVDRKDTFCPTVRR